MIFYERTNWYGLSYLLVLHGSLLPRLLPATAVGGVIGGITSAGLLDGPLGMDVAKDLFEHPYSFQLFGIVFGYLCIARLNISYQRYWEGVSQVKIMYSKWADACTQILAFDRLDDIAVDISGEPFCKHIVNLFVQLSALATVRLHAETIDFRNEHEMDADYEKLCRGELAGYEDIKFEQDEILFLRRSTDRVHCQVGRINRSITSRQYAGGLKAPPPIVSRVFQEISNGMVAYNSACKMKEIPVPFALVHFQTILLLFFVTFSPVVISCFVGGEGHFMSVLMSVIASVVVVAGFCALWLVANELEDPFGFDPNDMPMSEFHRCFCAMVTSSLDHPWLERDQWLNPEGPWLQPTTLVNGETGEPKSPPGATGKDGKKLLRVSNSSIKLLQSMQQQTAHTAKEWLASQVEQLKQKEQKDATSSRAAGSPSPQGSPQRRSDKRGSSFYLSVCGRSTSEYNSSTGGSNRRTTGCKSNAAAETNANAGGGAGAAVVSSAADAGGVAAAGTGTAAAGSAPHANAMQPAESQPAASSSQGAAATASRPVSHGVVAAPGPSLRVGSGLHV